MTEPIKVIRVADFVGGSICVSAADAERLYQRVLPLLENGHRTELSFEGVDVVISSFLNTAIGQVYGDLPAEQADSLLSWNGLDPDGDRLAEMVVENAKHHYGRGGDHDPVWEGETEDEADGS